MRVCYVILCSVTVTVSHSLRFFLIFMLQSYNILCILSLLCSGFPIQSLCILFAWQSGDSGDDGVYSGRLGWRGVADALCWRCSCLYNIICVRVVYYVCRLYDDEAVVKNNKIKHFPNKDANERVNRCLEHSKWKYNIHNMYIVYMVVYTTLYQKKSFRMVWNEMDI